MRIFWPNCREVADEGEITEAQRNVIDHLREFHDLTDTVEIEREFGTSPTDLGEVVLIRVTAWIKDIGLVWFDEEVDGNGLVHTRNRGTINLTAEGGWSADEDRWVSHQRDKYNWINNPHIKLCDVDHSK